MKDIVLPTMEPAQVEQEIGNFILSQVLKSGYTGAVIGLSGGVDSTTTAALAKHAFDTYNKTQPDTTLELVGYILPSRTNNPADTEDGKRVAERLGIRYEIHSIEPVLEAFKTTNPESFEHKYDKGNLASRIRANVLNTKSATERKILLGTGNKDEDFGIGYYTLFGDGAVHISPIGGLPKRLVCQMAAYLGFPDIAKRTPTAGLEPGQTDFGDLGYTYDVVEIVTEGIRKGLSEDTIARNETVRSYVTTSNREYAGIFGAPKFHNTETVIHDIWMRHHYIAKKKAEILHPEIAPVTLSHEVPR
ncbi:MAG: NAD(+) synthase [Nanoarchaeota archaeon]